MAISPASLCSATPSLPPPLGVIDLVGIRYCKKERNREGRRGENCNVQGKEDDEWIYMQLPGEPALGWVVLVSDTHFIFIEIG